MDLRSRVLAAAVDLVNEGGLASLSLREVARRAGVSHQAPYHHFADREAILAALAEEGFRVLGARLDDARTRGGTGAEKLARCGEVYVAFARQYPAHFRVMFRPDVVRPDRFPSVEACGLSAFQVLPDIIGACIADGLPPDPDPESLIVMGWALVHGLACLLLDGPLTRTLPDAAAAPDKLTKDVMAAMKALIDARAQGSDARAQGSKKAASAKKKPARKNTPRARAR